VIVDFASSGYALGEREFLAEDLIAASGRDVGRTLEKTGFQRLFRTELEPEDFFEGFLLQRRSLEASETVILVNQSISSSIPGLGPRLFAKLPAVSSQNVVELSDGCTGFVRALVLADSLIAAGLAPAVTIITGEVYSPYLSPNSSSAPIFSDAISALRLVEGDGFRVKKMAVRNSFEKHTAISLQETPHGEIFHMEGPSVLSWVLKNTREVANELKPFGAQSSSGSESWFIHQASKVVAEQVGEIIGISATEAFWAQNFGNTSSSSIPIGMIRGAEVLEKSQRVGLLGFGIGLSMVGLVLEKEGSAILNS
jgi:3-oxoacyl-[acyl-carrier-protein] synthase-3